jgi:hypothetical protein
MAAKPYNFLAFKDMEKIYNIKSEKINLSIYFGLMRKHNLCTKANMKEYI